MSSINAIESGFTSDADNLASNPAFVFAWINNVSIILLSYCSPICVINNASNYDSSESVIVVHATSGPLVIIAWSLLIAVSKLSPGWGWELSLDGP